MSDINAPLLSRRRIDDENFQQQPSSHNLINRNGDSEEEEEVATTDYGSGVYRYPAYLQPGHFTSLEKLFFFLSSILLILLFIFVGLYARSSQQEVQPQPPVVVLPPKNHTKKQVVCLEPNCIITAAQILQDVDIELDPCDDFYAYTCNKWKNSHLIPDVKSRIDVPALMTDNIRHRLDQILNRDFDSLSLNNLPDPNSILDRQLFTKLIDFYQSCMNQDPIEFKNITPLYPLFRSIRAFIPIDGGSVTKQGLNGAIQYLAEQNIWTLFELKVEPDIIYNPSKSINSLHQGHVGLSSYDDEDVTRVYMQTVISILDMIFKKDINNEFGWKSWSTIATARRIVEFEKKIASASAFEKEQPRRWSMDELEERVPQINWKQLLPTITTHVLIPHTNWIHHLNDQVLSDTNPRTLQMYFIWRSIWKYIDTLGEEFQVPKRKLDAKISGIEPRATPERWTTCIDLMDKSSMGVLLGRYFITDQQQSSIKETKEKVELLAKRIVKIIEDRVPHLSWLSEDDQVSKNEILAKLRSMEFQVGYSTSKPDTSSVISLSEYFSDVIIEKADFFGNMMKSNKHQVKQEIFKKDKNFDKNTWKQVNAQSVQVSYNKELNKVIIPGGLLQLPFIDIKGPNYLYFGTIGWLIGHEIMHGFDNIGRKYNSKGNFGSWWNDQTLDNLDSQNKCLVSQYNQLGINGEYTLNNNFADLGGLSLMEQLLLSNSTESVKIPGLNDWTKNQLTFIQFARMRCSKSTKEEELKQKKYSPDRYRVNGPLMNSNLFSKTFNCKIGSFLNPATNKCKVW